MQQEKRHNRIWEIDFFRGIAIILMSLFHLLYDLSEFYNFNIDYTTGIVDIIGLSSAIMFITLTGISSSLSKNNFKRAIKILFFAYIITALTYIYDPNTYINFGILHLIGVSILLYPFFKKLSPFLLLLLGLSIILMGNVFSNVTLAHNFLIPLGLTTSNYAALDYYPLFPYFGVFLWGIAMGRIFYPEKQSLFKFSPPAKNPISFLGRHSLFIYLTHQPVFLTLLFLLHRGNLL
ncbi:MAG: heparan-alpha-glucosaminide N-acetyltransferase [Peptococcales bacterium]